MSLISDWLGGLTPGSLVVICLVAVAALLGLYLLWRVWRAGRRLLLKVGAAVLSAWLISVAPTIFTGLSLPGGSAATPGIGGTAAGASSGTSGSGTGNSSGVTTYQGKVYSVADGDTFTMDTSKGSYRVRLLGIDAPEVAHDPTPADCGGDESAAALRLMLTKGMAVTVTTDSISDAFDQYGRVLGYVATKLVPDVNLVQISTGMAEAWVPSGEPHNSRWGAYSTASKAAKAAKIGLWGQCAKVGR